LNNSTTSSKRRSFFFSTAERVQVALMWSARPVVHIQAMGFSSTAARPMPPTSRSRAPRRDRRGGMASNDPCRRPAPRVCRTLAVVLVRDAPPTGSSASCSRPAPARRVTPLSRSASVQLRTADGRAAENPSPNRPAAAAAAPAVPADVDGPGVLAAWDSKRRGPNSEELAGVTRARSGGPPTNQKKGPRITSSWFVCARPPTENSAPHAPRLLL